MKEDENYRFSFQDELNWKNHLQKQGFVVIKNWLPRVQCEQYVEQFWSIMQYLAQGKLDRKNPQTQILSANYPPVLHGGMIQYIGHSRPQWEIRKKMRPIFQKLWNTSDLKSSFDGLCFMNGNRNYRQSPINSFLHCDQSPMINKIWSYQGVVCLTDSGENEGGFVCVPKSNHYHHQYFVDKKLQNHKANWYLVPEEDKNSQPFDSCLKVNNQAGDFILFDSRTFHCNTVPRTKVLRVCTYVCMLPRQHVPEKISGLRQLAVKNRRVSNHHPGSGFKTFPALPRYLNNPAHFEQLLKKVNDCQFDKDMLALI